MTGNWNSWVRDNVLNACAQEINSSLALAHSTEFEGVKKKKKKKRVQLITRKQLPVLFG